MVQRKINNKLEDLTKRYSDSQIVDLLKEYLIEKRKKKKQDRFMSPQTFVCYKAVKDAELERRVCDFTETLRQDINPDPNPDVPPYMEKEFPERDFWWDGVPHIVTPIRSLLSTKEQEDAYNRHA